MDVVSIGRAGLTGVPGTVGRKVSGPIARRTPLTQTQVQAIIGGLLLAFALWRLLKTARRIAREGSGS